MARGKGKQPKQDEVLRLMRDLAFGRANDCVRLVLEPGIDPDSLDLSLLTEVKRSEKGMVEVKLLDRVELLRMLIDRVESSEDTAADFLRALQAPAEDADV